MLQLKGCLNKNEECYYILFHDNRTFVWKDVRDDYKIKILIIFKFTKKGV